MKALHAGAQELGLALLACFTCANASIVLGKGHEKYSFAKAGRIPEVGVDAVHSICDPLVSECLPSDKRVQDELVVALQADSHTTVMGSVDVGQLMCDGLDNAPGSDLLRFKLTSDQTVVAERTSYSMTSGKAFSDNEDRKVWIGDVVYPAPPPGSSPTTISMTWAEPCNVETFLLEMVTQNPDGTATILTSVPCDAGLSSEICLVKRKVEFQDNATPFVDVIKPEEDGKGIVERVDKVKDAKLVTENLAATRHKKGSSRGKGSRRLSRGTVITPSSRRLQDSTQIDLLVFYTPDAMRQVVASTAAQMESIISAAFALTNEAMANSAISLDINVVHVQPLPYTAAVSTSAETLQTFRDNAEVKALRSIHRADLVTLLAQLSDGCGLGYLYPYHERSGFSVSRPNCFFQYTQSHELGHNLGCSHNREEYDSEAQQDYAHGFRYCDGADPYRTIMSYECPKANAFSRNVYKGNHYSNPDVYYLGKPTGTDAENCARAINGNKLTVSNFRVDYCMGPDGPCDSTPDCCTGTCVDGKCGLEECTGTLRGYQANGFCSTALNNLECGFDGGDCCECDCIPERVNECGIAGYRCLDPNACGSGRPVVVDPADDANSVCGIEFDACSADEDCAECLRVDESTTCRRDAFVDALHCAEMSEVVCCVFENNAGCIEDSKLRAVIDCLEEICPLDLVCSDAARRRLEVDATAVTMSSDPNGSQVDISTHHYVFDS